MNQKQSVYGYIYKITNLINGKVYIGQTTKSIETRFKDHKVRSSSKSSRYKTHLYKSMYLYGKQNFKVEELCICFYKEELDFMENFFIMNIYNSMNPDIGYNKKGGGGNGKLSEEIKRKISKANKGKKMSKEALTKLSISQKEAWGRKTEDTKKLAIKKYKESMAKKSPEELQAIIDKTQSTIKANGGVKHSKESRIKRVITRKSNGNDWHSEETKRKISETKKGKKLKKEQIDKMLATKKAKGILNYKHTKETKKKMSESNKLRWEKIKEKQKLENSDSLI